MSFPLQDAKFCVECNFIYASGGNTCVKCGSESSWVWLARYIKSMEGDNHERISKDTISHINNGDRRIGN